MNARLSAGREGARAPGETESDRHAAPNGLHASPRMLAQRARIDAAFGPVAQRQPGLEDEEPLQARTAGAAGGLPGGLRAGIEALSGMDMSGVRVHHNSDKPTQLNALAYAQGSDIHLAAGQEQHLPHEAWHVVQQAQGRAPPTVQLQGGVAVNDDAGLESEADAMGAQALAGVAQRVVAGTRQDMTPAPPGAALQMKGGRVTGRYDRVDKFFLKAGDRIDYDESGKNFSLKITINALNGEPLVRPVVVQGGDAVDLKSKLEEVIDEPVPDDSVPSEPVTKLSDQERLEATRLKSAETGSANPDQEGGVQNSFFTKPKAVSFDKSTGDIEVEMVLHTYNRWDRVSWKCHVGPRNAGVLLPEDQSWWSNPAWNAGEMDKSYAFRQGFVVSTLAAQGRGQGGVQRAIRTTVPGTVVKRVFGDLKLLKKSSIICFGMEVVYGGSGPATATKPEFALAYDANVQTAHQFGFGATSTPESYGFVDLSNIDIAEGDWLRDDEVWALDIGANPSPNIKMPMPENYPYAKLIAPLQPPEGMQIATRIENEATLRVSSLARLKDLIAQLGVLAEQPGLVQQIMAGDETLSQFNWTIHADTNSDVFTDVYLDDLRHTALRAGIGIRKRWTKKATKLNVKTGPGYQVGALDKDDRESDTVKSDIYRRHEIGYDLDPSARIEDIAAFLAAGPGGHDPWNRGGDEVRQALPLSETLDLSQLRGTMVLKGDRRKFNLKATHKQTGGAINIEISCDHTVGRTYADYEHVQELPDLFTANGKYAQVFNVEMELEHLGAGGKGSAQSKTETVPDTGPQDAQQPPSQPQAQPRRPPPGHPGRIYMRDDTANPNFNTPSFQVFAKAHQRMIQFLQVHLKDSAELGEDRQKLETLFAQLFPKDTQAYGPPVERGADRSASSRHLPTAHAFASGRSAATRVADKVPGGRLVNVDGTGLNCSIRALMLASGRDIDEKMVTQLREQLVNGAKATEGSFLGLGVGEKESRHLFELMASYLQGRPVVVLYDHQATLDEHQVWPGDGKPIVVYLSGYHYQAVVPG